MMTVYLDANFCCHIDPAEGRIAYETDFFEGKENQIESYRIVPEGQVWIRADGQPFMGLMITPVASPEGTTLFEQLLEARAALALIEEALNG